MSENALGGADSATDGSGKEFACDACGKEYSSKATLRRHRQKSHPDSFDVYCPTCGNGFDNKYGMRIHHNSVHGESIAGDLVECDWCGDEFRRSPSLAKKNDRNYCSDECSSKGRSERYSGEGHPCYIEDKPLVECEYCSTEFEVVPAIEDKTRFCSRDCQSNWWAENRSGKDNPLYTRVECECEICGTEVERKPSQIQRYENVFCSMECHREYQSIHQVGENHHNYEGGRADEYGPNWHRQRRKAIERDNGECQRCGVHRIDLERDIHVHHIKPRKKFMDEEGNLNYEEANRLDNLICLCSACHQTCESWGVRLDSL